MEMLGLFFSATHTSLYLNNKIIFITGGIILGLLNQLAEPIFLPNEFRQEPLKRQNNNSTFIPERAPSTKKHQQACYLM
jgi:hypothetical protein